MAFDDRGQAAMREDKVRTCLRSYTMMRSKIDFVPEVVIFVGSSDRDEFKGFGLHCALIFIYLVIFICMILIRCFWAQPVERHNSV